MDLIETSPKPLYIGELFETPTLDTITSLAAPLPAIYRLYRGAMPARQLTSHLLAPAFLPGHEDDGDCFWTCLTGAPARQLTEAGIPAAASGMVPKSWVGLPRGMAGASRFTTPASIIANRISALGRIRVPAAIPNLAPVAARGGVRLVPTTSLPRFVGRWIPGIGWALLAADVIAIDQCVAHCTGHHSMLRTVCAELTPFCIKPAY